MVVMVVFTFRSRRSFFHPETPRESRVMKRSMSGEADARPGYALFSSSMNFLLGPATIAPASR